MILKELILQPMSGWMTPLQADTIMGQVAWSIYFQEGVKAISDWIDRFRYPDPAPPVVLSDVFKTNWIPRPMLPVRSRDREPSREEIIQVKRSKSLRWLHMDSYAQNNYDQLHVYSNEGNFLLNSMTHNLIDRNRGTSLEENGLYSEEYWSCHKKDERLSLYIRTETEEDLNYFMNHLKLVLIFGIGKKKNIGYGRFHIYEMRDRTCWLKELSKDANAEMWMSHGTPALHDPTRGVYRIDTKYGKIGEGWDRLRNPFKKPITRIVPGSVFFLNENNSYKGWAGRLLERVSDNYPEVVQFAFSLTFPMKLEGLE